MPDKVIETSKSILREAIDQPWRLLRAVEVVVAEAEEAFGEDSCVPPVRRQLDHTRERLVDVHERAQWSVGPFELPQPDDETLEQARAFYERDGRPP